MKGRLTLEASQEYPWRDCITLTTRDRRGRDDGTAKRESIQVPMNQRAKLAECLLGYDSFELDLLSGEVKVR